MNKLTIALFTYNSQKYANDAVINLLKFAKYHEILIVDDGSTDQTNVIISRLLDELNVTIRERITHVKNTKNIGTVKQFLKAAMLCKTKYIKPLDCADIIQTEHFQDIIDRFDEHGFDVIFTRPCFVENEILYEDTIRTNIMKKTIELDSKKRLLSLYTVNNLIAPTAFFNTEFIKKVIPKLNAIKLIEDWPMWIYASSIDSNFDYLDKIFIGYRIHKNQTSKSQTLKNVLNNDLKQIQIFKDELIFGNSLGARRLIYKIKSKLLNKFIKYV